jgi:hypothetical protein
MIDGYRTSPECDRKLKNANEEFNRINLCNSDADCMFVAGCDAANVRMSSEKLKQLLRDETCGFYTGLCVGVLVRCDRGRCIRSLGDAGDADQGATPLRSRRR